MKRQLISAVLMVVVLTVLLGVAYPLVVTGAAQVAFRDKANGSLIKSDHRAVGSPVMSSSVVGSRLIGQNFADARYFHPRPSAAGSNGYDGTASAATNLGPSNGKLLLSIQEAVAAYRQTNHLPGNVKVPADAVTSSGSGLDPQISITNARLQAQRVADARGLPLTTVDQLVDRHTRHRSLGFLGDAGVNVLQLNLSLDALR